MKKSLFAIAAVTAFAGAAQAQSSVTVYGILDTGFSAASATTTINGVAVSNNASTTGNESSQTTSRLGFRGNEDLGGGTSALFVLETGISSFGDAQATTMFTNRVSYIGLSDKSLGTVHLGRQYQSLHAVIGAGSAGGQNNVAGAIYSSSGIGVAGSISQTRPYAVNIDNAITYVSPTVSGVTLEVQTGQTRSNTAGATATSATTAATETGGSLRYTGIQNLFVGYAYSQKATVTASTSNTRVTAQALSANYNFGVAQVFLLGTGTKVDTVNTGVNLSNMKQYELGVKAPVTKTISAFASIYSGNMTSGTDTGTQTTYNFTAAQGHADISGFQLGAQYDLSKRTNLYAIYGQGAIKGKSAATGDKLETSQYALGMRHTF